MKELTLDPIEKVIASLKAGQAIILVDDELRENEGDLVVVTEMVTADAVNFMLRHGRGLVCCSISEEDAARLNLPLQTLTNRTAFNTPFTVSVDHKSVIGFGGTAAGRAVTMRALCDKNSKSDDFVSPGYTFPLIANKHGVLGRQGQTEGSFELARICGFRPSGVICEILGEDGRVLRGQNLHKFASDNLLPVTSIAEIQRYRIEREVLVAEVARSVLSTDHGPFETFVFEDEVDRKEHLALVKKCDGNWSAPLVRIHSECLTGDVFGSMRCDCGEQLSNSMQRIASEGGIVLYLQQEGRGIGLGNKVKAYALQDLGADTIDANLKLGFKADERNFAVAAKILRSLGVRRIRLLTNNLEKLSSLEMLGIEVSERIPLIVSPNHYSKGYLETKRDRFGHLL